MTPMASQGTSGIFSQRRLPVYIVMDHSVSLQGTGMVSLNQGVQDLSQQLAMGMLSAGTVYLGLIAFADRVQQAILAPIGLFRPPHLNAGGACALGAALAALRRAFEYDLIPDAPGRPGDHRPLVFVVLGGTPTDIWQPEARQVYQIATSRQANIVGVALSAPAEAILKQITTMVVCTVPGRAQAITAFFSWMCAAIDESARTAVSSAAGHPAQPVQLPGLPTGVTRC